MRGVVRSGPRRKVTAGDGGGSLNFVTNFTLRDCRSARLTFPYVGVDADAPHARARRKRDARVYLGPAPARTVASTVDAASSVTVYGGVNTLPPRRSAVMPLVPV